MRVYSKVKAVGLAGIITTIIIAALNYFGADVSAELAAAILTVVTFIVGYFKVERVGR
jgi:hypothetical protein